MTSDGEDSSNAPPKNDRGTGNSNSPRNNRRNNNKQGAGGGRGNSSTTGNGTGGFRGDTTDMKGHVFEQPSKGNQYLETLTVLKRYTSVTYESGPAMMSLFTAKPTKPKIKPPGAEPTPTGKVGADGKATRTTFDEEMFKLDVKAYRAEAHDLNRDLVALFAVIVGQCNQALQATLMSQDGFSDRELDGDCLWLLSEIRSAATRFDKTLYIHDALHDLRGRFYREHQGSRPTVEYYRTFDALIKTLDDNHAWDLPPLQQDTDASLRGPTDADTRRNIRERQLAAAFILNSDNKRFASLKSDLRANYARGTNQWPRTLLDAYNLLVTQERNDAVAAARRTKTPKKDKDGTGTTPNGPPRDRERPPPRATDPHQFAMTQVLNQPRGGAPSTLPTGAILLDSESTTSIFKDPNLLTNLRDTTPPLLLNTNGGHHSATQIGEYHGLGDPLTMWFNPKSLANILALCDVRRHVQVTLDTAQELAFLVHLPDGPPLRFVEHDTGLYIYLPDHNDVKIPVTAYSYLQTVAANRQHFTRREVQGADTARALYRHIGRPSQARFEQYIRKGLIRNCPITVGPDIAYLKGKTTQKPSLPHIATHIPVPLPAHIAQHHRDVTVCADFFFVQRQTFLHFISRKLGYRTSIPVENRSKATIIKALREELKTYVGRGFVVRDVHADSEFECVRDMLCNAHTEDGLRDLPGSILLETCTANEHVKEVERSIRTIKEMLRATTHGMPYRRLPKQMVKGLVAYCTINLNSFPYSHGVSQELSPSTIMHGTPAPDYKNYRLEFGTYVLCTDKTTNTPRARAFGAIALHPTGGNDGSYRFMSLSTGEVISRAPGYWTVVPISDMVIGRVEALAKHQSQPLLQNSNLVVENSPDQEIDDDEFDVDFVPNNNDDNDDDDDNDDANDDYSQDSTPSNHGAIDGDDIEDDDPNAVGHLTGTNEDEPAGVDESEQVTTAPPDTQEDSNATEGPDNVTEDAESQHDATEPHPAGEAEILEETDHGPETSDVGEGEEIASPQASGDDNQPNTDHGEQIGYNLRGDRTRSYAYRFANAIDEPASQKSYYDDTQHNNTGAQFVQIGHQPNSVQAALKSKSTTTERVLTGWVLTQMTAKAGIRRYGDAARDAMRAEFRQLDQKGVFEPIMAQALTRETRAQALRCINLIKEKRCGKIKGRTCADGRPQRKLYERSETSSPTASSDAIMLTLAIDALEGRDVATADVAGAYLNAEMNDYVLMRLEGEDVDLMCDMNPSYKEYVWRSRNGKKSLYLRLARALYGCVQSALLWYELFSSTLKQMGFKLNPYDLCVANAQIKGAQCTVVWYVDDNKISHIDPSVVSDVIRQIETKFGKMTVTRGLQHEFLGMHIVLDRKAKTVKITMASYLQEAIAESGMDISRVAATPATHSLFEVGEGAAPLTGATADVFRRIVCKLLYVGIRARADILTALSYLTTRVSKPNIHDYKKLKRLLEYLNGTMDLALVIGADGSDTLYTWVDASYATHHDMRSHTGGVISLGTGGILCKSTKQKLNTKSSTEAEVIGVSDYLPSTIWAMNFMDAQGVSFQTSSVAQDNQSAIKLATNGRASAGHKSRHINIRHFWITDRLKAEGITIHYCPTEQMLADFLTKPLQGSLFRKFRAVLLGHTPIHSLTSAPTTPSFEERVGGKQKRTAWADVVTDGPPRSGSPTVS